MQRLAPYAEELDVNLAIEYVWNRFLLSPMEFARTLSSGDRPVTSVGWPTTPPLVTTLIT